MKCGLRHHISSESAEPIQYLTKAGSVIEGPYFNISDGSINLYNNIASCIKNIEFNESYRKNFGDFDFTQYDNVYLFNMSMLPTDLEYLYVYTSKNNPGCLYLCATAVIHSDFEYVGAMPTAGLTMSSEVTMGGPGL